MSLDFLVIGGAFIVLLALPFYLVHLYLWFWFWLTLAVVLGIFELISLSKKGKTLSQTFWEWSRKNRKKKWLLFTVLMLFWLVLMFHLFY